MNRSPLSLWLGFLALGVLPAAAEPSITIPPKDQTVSVGASVSLNVSAVTDTPPLSYQWWLGATALENATNRILKLTNLQASQAGGYSVVVSDAVGSVTSQVAIVTVDPTFVKITTGAIATDKDGSSAASWFDYDNDNLLDLYVANYLVDGSSSKDSVYHNNGDGTFTKITNAISAGSYPSVSGAVADFDEDGNLDLFRLRLQNLQDDLFRGDGHGGFTRVAGPMSTLSKDESIDAAWADYDGDGLLDLLVSNGFNSAGNDALYRNNGDGTFTRMTAQQVGPIVSDNLSTALCFWVDYDADGLPDAFVFNRSGPNRLYHNQGDGTFALAQAGSLTTEVPGWRGCWSDYDNDGYPDFFGQALGGDRASLHRNLGNGKFSEVGALAGFGRGTSLTGTWGDYDNDGFLDLFAASYQGTSVLYRNRGDGTFEAVDVGSPLDDGTLRSIPVWADYDNDGFLDLFVSCGDGNPTPNLLYRNNLPATGNANHWLKVKLTGTASNRSAIGAKIRVKATIGGRSFWQMREISGNSGFSGSQPLTAHFGLGDATTVDLIRIEWPSGIVQEFASVPANQLAAITEHEDGNPPAPTLTAAPSDTGAVKLTLTGQPHCGYVIQGSDDLVNWVKVRGCHTLTGTVEHTDLKVAGKTARFYRVLAP